MSENQATPPTCPYCGSIARLGDSATVYRGRSYGPAWICPNYPACDSYVGCHPKTTIPLGRLANKELRQAKMAAHAAFDRLWGGRGNKGKPRRHGQMKRSDAYRWLSQAMGMQESSCHIGELDVDQCRRVVELCREKMGVGAEIS